MRAPWVWLFVLLTAASLPVYGDAAKDDIDRAIDMGKLHHPYLYFDESDLAAMKERAKADPAFGDILARTIAEAHRLLYTPADPTAPPRPRDQVWDNTWKTESFILDNADKAYTLAFAYQATGDPKFAKKAFEFADVVCDQPTWVHGYHEFPVFYDRVWPWGAKDDEVVFSYAQWSDHVVFRMAVAYDWLYPALSKRERDRIRGALLEKAILRVRGNYDYHWWATAYRCNWCAVCNGSLGAAAAALLTEDPQLTDVLAESYNRISKTLDQIGDGGWGEGIGYLNYTVTESLNFGEVLRRVTGGKFDLYRHPSVERAMLTLLYGQIPPDESLHFADTGGGRYESYSLLNRIVLRTGSGTAAWLLANRTSNTPSEMPDLFYPKAAPAPALPAEPSIRFKSTEWIIMRSDFTDPGKMVLAAKCGLNNDPHHGHLDVGHFSIYWKGKEFVCDNGSAVQDKAYFYEDRWTYPLASCIGHNVVMVNGELQQPCKRKNQAWDERYGGKVLLFRPGTARDYALLDPSGAYPKKELLGWRRHLILEKPTIAVVLDEISCKPGAEVTARFHSPAAMDIRGKFVLLRSGDDRMALIPFVRGGCALKPGKHAVLAAEQNASFRWVPYVDEVTTAKEGRTIVATVILPADERQAGAVSESLRVVTESGGDETLTFAYSGKKYSYRFGKTTDGFVLKEDGGK
jgi:hypothetical protein